MTAQLPWFVGGDAAAEQQKIDRTIRTRSL